MLGGLQPYKMKLQALKSFSMNKLLETCQKVIIVCFIYEKIVRFLFIDVLGAFCVGEKGYLT